MVNVVNIQLVIFNLRVISMPRDKTESHARVLAAARKEFLEYGFENASMRRIGEKAGMSAAALYRHCKDKEDLFEQTVSPSIRKIDDWMRAHISRCAATVGDEKKDLFADSWVDLMRDLIYPNMDEYRLLLTKAQGTRHENFLHDFTQKHQKKMMEFLSLISAEGRQVHPVSERELHILLSAYSAAMFEPVVHGYSKQEALDCLETLEAFFLPGWKKLFGF